MYVQDLPFDFDVITNKNNKNKIVNHIFFCYMYVCMYLQIQIAVKHS